jgi:hypothetical protein
MRKVTVRRAGLWISWGFSITFQDNWMRLARLHMMKC